MLRKFDNHPLPHRDSDDEPPPPSSKKWVGWVSVALGLVNGLWTLASLGVARMEEPGEGLTALVLAGVCVSSPFGISAGVWAGSGTDGVKAGRAGATLNAVALLAAVLIFRSAAAK